MERLLLRPREAAALLGLGRSTVYELIASGAIPSLTIGRSRRGARRPSPPRPPVTSSLPMPAERPLADLRRPPRRGLGTAPVCLREW